MAKADKSEIYEILKVIQADLDITKADLKEIRIVTTSMQKALARRLARYKGRVAVSKASD